MRGTAGPASQLQDTSGRGVEINPDQELQDKQKLYLRVFFRNCNSVATDLGRNPNLCSKGERVRVYKDRKRGVIKRITTCLERAVIGAGKETYIMLYRINCLCLLLGAIFFI